MAIQTRPQVGPASAGAGRDWLSLPKWLSRHPWVITAVLAAVLLVLPATGGDLAAQEYHAWLFKAHGALLWNNYWYSGHLVSGYSLLFPPLAALVGTRLLGSLAAVAAAAAMSALLGCPRAGRGLRLAGGWFAVGILGPLVVGQLPFGIGVTLSLAALLAAVRHRPWLAAVAALAASLTSPLAGAFLLMVALAWATEVGVRRAAPLASAAIGVVVASLLGGGGYFPFPLSALLVVLLFSGGGLVLVRNGYRAVRWGLLLYGLSAIVIFAVQNPVGGNITRLGALVGGPLAAAVLGARRRWWTLSVVAVPLLCWQLWPGVTAVTRSIGDPSSSASYYTGLNSFLDTQDVAQGRLEVPTLSQHWESYYVAQTYPLARGWERQIDLRDNDVLYQPDLTPDQLHEWLVSSGVGLVALPDAPLDYWARREAAIISAGQPWLKPVWSDAHWQVWRVSDSPGLLKGPAQLTALGVSSFQLLATGAGTSDVRVHWSPFWQVTAGRACLREGPGGWMTVQTAGPGPVTVTARWSLSAVFHPATAIGACG